MPSPSAAPVPPGVRRAGPALPHRAVQDMLGKLEASRNDVPRFARHFFGFELSPWQRAELANAGRVNACVAGRRSGKTTVNLIRAVHDLTTRGRNRNCLIAGPSIDQAVQYFRELEDALAREGSGQLLELLVQ